MRFSAISPSVTIINLALMAIFWANLYSAHPVSESFVHRPLQLGIELTSTKNISSPSHTMSYSIDLLPPPSPSATPPPPPPPPSPPSHAIQNASIASLTMPNQASIVNVQSPATAVFNTLRADGTYAFGYKTPDGQSRTENTLPDGTKLGNYEYRTPEGNLVTINYSAGRHGFVTTYSGSSHGSNTAFANADGYWHLPAASAGPNNSIPESTAGNYQQAISGEINHHPFPVFEGFQNLSDGESGVYFGDRASYNLEASNPFVISGASNPFLISGASNPVAKSEILAIPRVPLQSSSSSSSRNENVGSGAYSNAVATSVGSNSVAMSGESNPSEGIVDAHATSVQSLPAIYPERNPPASYAATNPPIVPKSTNFMATSDGSAPSVTWSSSLFDGRPTTPASKNVYSYSINSNPAGSLQLAVSSDQSVSLSSSSSSSVDNNEAGGVKQTTTSSGLPTSSLPIWLYARNGAVPQQVAHQPSYVPFGHLLIPEHREHANSAPIADDASTYQESTAATSGLKVAPALSTSTNQFPFAFAYGSNPNDVKLQQYLS